MNSAFTVTNQTRHQILECQVRHDGPGVAHLLVW